MSGRPSSSSGQARRGRTAWRVLLGGTLAGATVLCTAIAPVDAAPKPLPNPPDSQINAAAKQKADLANAVGVLTAQIAQAQTQQRSLAAQAELAEQRFAFAQSQLDAGKEKATAAKTAVVTAQANIDKARANLTDYVHSSYISPPVGSTTLGLLGATDPSSLLQGGDYQRFVTSHSLDAMTALDRATVAKSNAVANANLLVQQEQKLATAAAQAQQAAQVAYAQKKAQSAQLQAEQVSKQNQLAVAQLRLATLNNERAIYVAHQKYLAYVKQQELIRQAKAAAAAHARQLAILAEQERERQQQQQQQGNSGSGGGGSVYVGGGGSPAPSGPSGGSWTAAKGQAAASKALSQLGVPYAWAGGNYYGVTRGVDSPGTDGWNDSNVIGFDCSGLTLFAWYPALQMPHFAASQYFVAGSFHPQPNQFMPGDLLFWSDGGADAIHHVAIYIGNGDVVQAPNSGDVVKVTPWDQVSYGYFGATRPLT